MQLFGMRLSPFVRKVLLFAAEKGIALEVVPASMGQGGPAFEDASPFGKIPALVDGDYSICDSTAIITYLDTLYPEPNLIPAEAKARARTIWYEEFGDTIVQPATVPVFFNRLVAERLGRPVDHAAADQAETEKVPPLFDYLERMLPDSGFLVEDRFTLADISVVCPIINFSYCSTVLTADRWPRLHAYVAAIRERESVRAVLAEEAAMMKRLAA
ncbi:MAG: glutathione S-transferase family protein [Sphingobium sp.]|nr:glutathione S-transferase family protein [Sphingobium sp.]